ncbi:DUF2065 domain-containing protein [Curvibacter sp. APW13]|uniref:DUF2065 domain-containing protein n=1 Tax=Curvibacter sp. APW13 TaxID=3077236 RepID=UPI0028DF6000|nr:DUF2065 domain-containing protein [Curvibacter sp. APW13]MDT8991713.1 DUF2065 domain-containing protein [Curvibacter sp. APW13]
MNSDLLWVACGLVLVLEGLYPFVSPQGWRRLFLQLLQLRDDQVRTVGLVAVVLGLALIWIFGR